MRNLVLLGDVREKLREIPDGVVQCCVTSPPYYGLRSYLPEGHDEKALEIGLEQTPEEYVANMVEVFREVRRALRDDGVLFCNLGDSYANDAKWGGSSGGKHVTALHGNTGVGRGKRDTGLKPKDLIGIPWRVAFALQADGWYLRQELIWHKPNPLPEPVQDRFTKAHEHIFLLTKKPRYFFDTEAVQEETNRVGGKPRQFGASNQTGTLRQDQGNTFVDDGTRNRRSVWTIPVQPYRGAHFATMPEAIPDICIRAGTSEKGSCPKCGAPWARTEGGWEPTCKCGIEETVPCIVLDPFTGSGTTLAVAKYLRRDYLGCELNSEYHKLIEERLRPAEELEAERQGFDEMLQLGE